jgi:hypothetical protein
MLTFLIGAILGGLAVWKYRDSLTEYVKGSAGPAREKVDGLLGTVQHKSEHLLDRAKEQVDRAKEQVSTRLESAREKVRAGESESTQGRPTE